MPSVKTLSRLNHIFGFILYCLFLLYFGSSIAAFVVNASELGAGGIILNLFVLVIELLGPLYATYFLIQNIDGVLDIGSVAYDIKKTKDHPAVDVIVPVHNVNPKILDLTLEGCSKFTYPNFKVWIADDNSLPEFEESAQKLAQKYGFTYLRGKGRSYKAGVVNQALAKAEASFVVVFDSDQIPVPDILDKYIAILEQHPEFAFVQAKYEFRSVSNFLHIWETMSTHQLFVSEGGKRRIKSVVFFGTSACFRKEHLYPLPENKLSEDYDHYITIAAKGHYGYWLNEVAAKGLSTESFDHKMSQMFRWTKGQFGAVMDHKKELIVSKLRLRQRVDIFMSSTVVVVLTAFYFMGALFIVHYFTDIPMYRALGIDQLALIIMPVIIALVYFGVFGAVGAYSKKSNDFKFRWWHVLYFMLYGALMAPFLLIPLGNGLLGRNKIKPGKKFQWNKKIRVYLIAVIYTILGAGFAFLGAISLMDTLDIGPFQFYTEPNMFYIMFLSIAFMLIFALPFVAISKKFFKIEEYYTEDTSIYY
ncbi:MAG: glycosyltransferase [Candidatus Heimdallarchaeaceae archaeon]